MDRKQGRDEDPRKYYADKMKLWEQAHAPDKRNLVGFKNEMLRCMDNEELKDKCRFFMPEKLQHENEIKEVQERQLSHDMDGLNVTYTDSFETVENRKRADEMWETGKIPMEVNRITRIIMYEPRNERGEMSGDVNRHKQTTILLNQKTQSPISFV